VAEFSMSKAFGVWRRSDKSPARTQDSKRLPHHTLWIVDMLDHVATDNRIKGIVRIFLGRYRASSDLETAPPGIFNRHLIHFDSFRIPAKSSQLS
jgi:hypothetical protein